MAKGPTTKFYPRLLDEETGERGWKYDDEGEFDGSEPLIDLDDWSGCK